MHASVEVEMGAEMGAEMAAEMEEAREEARVAEEKAEAEKVVAEEKVEAEKVEVVTEEEVEEKEERWIGQRFKPNTRERQPPVMSTARNPMYLSVWKYIHATRVLMVVQVKNQTLHWSAYFR